VEAENDKKNCHVEIIIIIINCSTPVKKTEITAVGVRRGDHVTPLPASLAEVQLLLTIKWKLFGEGQ
jgi:hypothetical protein